MHMLSLRIKTGPCVFGSQRQFWKYYGRAIGKTHGASRQSLLHLPTSMILCPHICKKSFNPRPSHPLLAMRWMLEIPATFRECLNYSTETTKPYRPKSKDTHSRMKKLPTRCATCTLVDNYILDPHGAVGYLGLKKYFNDSDENATGIFLETAHPSKFKEVVDETLKTRY